MCEHKDENKESYKVLMESFTEMEVKLPDNHDTFVNDTLEKLPKKHSIYYRNIAKSAAAFFISVMIVSLLIYSNESFASFAKGIPGLNLLADLITSDYGSESAMLHGYPVKDPIVIQDGDYTLTIKNMMIDEERITFSTQITGPYFDLPQEGEQKAISAEPIEDDGFDIMDKPYYDYDVFLSDGGTAQSTYFEEDNIHTISIVFGESTKDYISSLLASDSDLFFECAIRKSKDHQSEDIYNFKQFSIPLSEEDVLPTKDVAVHQSIEFDQGIITFDEMTISPSKMQLIGQAKPEAGVESVGLKDVVWMDSSGLEFTAPSISRFGGGDGYVAYQLIPSIYFEEMDTITMHYDSYYYSLPHEAYTISLDDQLPKTYDYYGHRFTIEEMKKNADTVVIKYTIEDESAFMIQDIALEGYSRTSSGQSILKDDATKNEYFTNFDDVGEERVFHFTLDRGNIIVKASGNVTIPLDLQEK